MSDNAQQVAPPSPKKAAVKPKGKRPPTKQADHPPYRVMITAACSALKDRKGSSRQKISKYIKANYKVGDKAHIHINPAIKHLLKTGELFHTKGTGASGSFKLPKKEAAPKKKKTIVKKKPAAKKVTAKKTTKKPKAKKVAKKATPKKAKAKATGKPKAKKSATKKPVVAKSKKPKVPAKKTTKKSPAKKTVKKAKSTAKPKKK
jgi:linker histone H1 and H5 family.